MESIEPFDFKEAVDFQTAYLAGYFADKYDVTASECEERANERIRRSTEAAFRDTVRGYASVVPENTSIRLHNGTTKYALYPVWILQTKWKGDNYIFAMNGQTGKFVGICLQTRTLCTMVPGNNGGRGCDHLILSCI